MRRALRLAAPALLLIAAVVAMLISGAALGAAAAGALAIHLGLLRRLIPALRAMAPVLLFAAILLALGWLGGASDPTLALRTVTVFLLSTAAFRIVPWKGAASRLSPHSPLYTIGLFLLFMRHFAEILAGESRRTLQARGMCVRGIFAPGGFSSLGWAVAAIFRRSLVRAERFHAAQSLAGIVE